MELFISFNCNVNHCMGLVMLHNYEYMSVIIGYDMASKPYNQIHGEEHRLNHSLGNPRETLSSLIRHKDLRLVLVFLPRPRVARTRDLGHNPAPPKG